MDDANASLDRWSWWHLLFVVEAIAVLWPPFYNKAEPALMGVPFFYWYQMSMVVVSAALTGVVYFATGQHKASA